MSTIIKIEFQFQTWVELHHRHLSYIVNLQIQYDKLKGVN